MDSFLGCYLALRFTQIAYFLVYVGNGAKDKASPSHSLEEGIFQSNGCNIDPQPQWGTVSFLECKA